MEKKVAPIAIQWNSKAKCNEIHFMAYKLSIFILFHLCVYVNTFVDIRYMCFVDIYCTIFALVAQCTQYGAMSKERGTCTPIKRGRSYVTFFDIIYMF